MKTEQILQLVEAVSGFGLDEFEYEEDGVKLKKAETSAHQYRQKRQEEQRQKRRLQEQKKMRKSY